MGMLHTVNKSPFQTDSLSTCLRYAKPGASVLLIEDGVYGAREGTAMADDIKEALKDKSVYVLEPDLNARGINSNLIDGVKLVDYAGFVDLTTECELVQSWL
jgi:tRNA 2-thiouridine synthesizing protein B